MSSLLPRPLNVEAALPRRKPLPPIGTGPRYKQAHYSNELKHQWRVWFHNGAQDLGLTDEQLANRIEIDKSYIHMFRRGFIPLRPVIIKIGQVFGSEAAALNAAGWIPDLDINRDASELSIGRRELLGLLDQLGPEDEKPVLRWLHNVLRERLRGRKRMAC